MAAGSRAVSVGTSATRLDTADDTSDGNVGESIVVFNNGSATVFIGGSGVTTAQGTPVAAGAFSPGLDLGGQDAVYGIVASGAVEVRVLETGL